MNSANHLQILWCLVTLIIAIPFCLVLQKLTVFRQLCDKVTTIYLQCSNAAFPSLVTSTI